LGVAFPGAATSLCVHEHAVRAGGSGGAATMIFKGVRDGRPYPEHGLSYRDWSAIPPRQIRLDELVTTTTVLALDRLLSEDSTFYGDLFPHAVKWKGVLYLEDGLHRAVRAALRNRVVLHARLFDMDTALPERA
jgi:Arc/MetJ family transcription regulator